MNEAAGTSETMIGDLSFESLEDDYRREIIKKDSIVSALKKWNKAHDHVQAIFFMGKIRTFNPKKYGLLFTKLKNKYGLKIE